MVAQGADAYHRAKALFLEALEKPDDQRAAFVEQECGQDQGLCEEVMAFLKAYAAGGGDPTVLSLMSMVMRRFLKASPRHWQGWEPRIEKWLNEVQ